MAKTTLSSPLGEALLHRLAEERDQPGVVCGQPALEPLEPFVVAEDAQVVVAERLDAPLGHAADGRALVRVGQAHAVAHHLAHCVVARGAAEDEDDGRQHVAGAELLDHLGAPGTPVGQAWAVPGSVPPARASLERPPARLVDAEPLPRRLPAWLQQWQQERLVVLAPVYREVVAQVDRAVPFDDHRGVATDRVEPAAQFLRVVDRGGQADEAHLGR